MNFRGILIGFWRKNYSNDYHQSDDKSMLIVNVVNRLNIIHPVTRRITYIDVLVGIYLLWSVLNMLFIARLPFGNILLWKWSIVLGIYLVVRNIPWKDPILWILVLVGTAQSLCAIGQHAGYIASNHRWFDVTGFMGNPGQLGGFQAVTFVAVFVLLKKNVHSRIAGCVLFSLLLLIGYSMWLADSRAGGVAVLAGLIALYWLEIRPFLTRHKRLLWPIFVVVIGLGILVFNYRADSAKARLLIWRVSANMIADKPVTGHGVGAFNRQYMLYQADYFEQNPDSQFRMVADNTAYPYNEFLHIWIELGLIGLLLVLGIVYMAVIIPPDKTMSAPLVAWLVFSCFSYPSYKLELLALSPILLGLVGGKAMFQIKRKFGVFASILIAAIVLSVGIHGYILRNRVNHKALLLIKSYDQQDANYVSMHVRQLYPDFRFNTLYLYNVLKYPKIAIESAFDGIMPTSENWCDIGDYYFKNGVYDCAENYYRTAAWMVPTRITPNYLLWKMYMQQNRVEDAQVIENYLLVLPLKVENTVTIRIKNEVREAMRE